MGVSAVNSHAKGPTHLAKLKRQNEEPTQSKIILGATGKVAVASSSLGKKIAAEEIPEELYALRAEVYETLHKVEYNCSSMLILYVVPSSTNSTRAAKISALDVSIARFKSDILIADQA